MKPFITLHHLDNMNKIILATGSMVGLAYATEFFIAWYGGNPFETFAFRNRAFGPYAWAYWTMVTCNVITPQLFWFKRIRHSLCGDVDHLHLREHRHVVRALRDHRHLAAAAISCRRAGRYFRPTPIDVLTFVGSFGLFLTLFLLFIRFLPMVAMAEVKTVMPAVGPHGGPLRSVGDYHGDIHTPSRPKGVQP